MDGSNNEVTICDASGATAQGPQWNLQIFTTIIKQETIEGVDEERTHSDGDMPSQSSSTVNYYDNQLYTIEEVKKEYPDDECHQSIPNTNSEIITENEGASKAKVLEIKEIKQETSEAALPLIVGEEIDHINTQIIVKAEALEEHKVLDNAGDRSVLYEVSVTPQEIQPEMYGGMYQNSFHLLKHNNDHMKVEPPTRVDDIMNELPKFVADVRSNIKPTLKLSQKPAEPKNNEVTRYKCDSCERFYKSKSTLVIHTKKNHCDYGRMFECFCGKEFRSPIHLQDHKYNKHKSKTKRNRTFQCDYCKKIFKTKACLLRHIRSIHYDYGKYFKCWCGKQYRTPICLYKHKNRLHGTKVTGTDNAVLMTPIQWDAYRPKAVSVEKQQKRKTKNKKEIYRCEYCWLDFKVKGYLVGHIKRMHK